MGQGCRSGKREDNVALLSKKTHMAQDTGIHLRGITQSVVLPLIWPFREKTEHRRGVQRERENNLFAERVVQSTQGAAFISPFSIWSVEKAIRLLTAERKTLLSVLNLLLVKLNLKGSSPSIHPLSSQDRVGACLQLWTTNTLVLRVSIPTPTYRHQCATTLLCLYLLH